MKTATQLKAKSRNLSAATGAPPHIIQRSFLFERFLDRAALSEHRDSFIIKGGMLISSIVGINIRATMDLDATLQGGDMTEGKVKQIISDIIAVDLDDSTAFCLLGAERTRVEADYPGWRISLDAIFDNIHDTLKLDITVGDVITPRAVEYSYKLMFEDRSVNVLAYNLETALAEKFAACISLGTVNTRMKDYYDIFILTQTQRDDISPSVFADALTRTAAQRHIELGDCNRIMEELTANIGMTQLWKRYQLDNRYADGINFADTLVAMRVLAEWGGLTAERKRGYTLLGELAEVKQLVAERDAVKQAGQSADVPRRNSNAEIG